MSKDYTSKNCAEISRNRHGSRRRNLITACAAVLAQCCSMFMLAGSHAFADEPTHRDESSKIARGRYLVKTTGCNDCHTPGYVATAGKVDESQWLIGDRLGYQGPWGTTYPANLRRHMQTLSADEWLQLARRPMRPPMPWFALRDMTDEDLVAIYHFVRSLGPAGGAPPAYVPPGQSPQTPVVTFPTPKRQPQRQRNQSPDKASQ
jgi:mono/diheme cytochrome c family protein